MNGQEGIKKIHDILEAQVIIPEHRLVTWNLASHLQKDYLKCHSKNEWEADCPATRSVTAENGQIHISVECDKCGIYNRSNCEIPTFPLTDIVSHDYFPLVVVALLLVLVVLAFLP